MQPGSEHPKFPPAGKESKHPSALQDFFPYMAHVARKLVGRNDADDVANAALFDALRSKRPKPPLDKPLEVKRYLRRLVWFRALAHWKRKKKFRREICASPEIEYNESPSTTALNAFEKFFLHQALENGMRRLDAAEQTVLRGYYLEGLTAKELATNLGEVESSVRSRIDRAVKKVAAALEDESRSIRSGWAIFLLLDETHVRLSRFCARLTNLGSHFGFAKVAIAVGACIGLAIPAWHIAPQILETPAHGLPTDTSGAITEANQQPHAQLTTFPEPPLEAEQSPIAASAPILGPPNLPRETLTPGSAKRKSSGALPPKPMEPHERNTVDKTNDAPIQKTITMSCQEALNLALAEANVGRADACRRALVENAASADPCPDARMAEALRGCDR